MQDKQYIDTFYKTIFPDQGKFVPLAILVAIWNAPIVALVVICKTLYIWQKRADQRRHLGSLDTACLRDMGISVEAAADEAGKFFWRK